ncbi:MAG: hypothetical protein IT266_10505 [Saprospiraceae bacterium]|nr:hypothetical protein [Saprospiraceae bacterium]
MMLSGMREIIGISAFLANRDRIQTTQCVRNYKPGSKCKGKCFLYKKLQESKGAESPSQIPVVQLPAFDLFYSDSGNVVPRVEWILSPDFFPPAPLNSQHFPGRVFQPPDRLS